MFGALVRYGLLGMPLLTLACATHADGQDRQLRDLHSQIKRLQASTDRLEERIAAIENARVRERQVPTPLATPTTTVPELPVVKMNAEPGAGRAESQVVQSDSDEPRTLIVGEGTRIETRSATGEPASVSSTPRTVKEKSKGELPREKRVNAATDKGKKTP